MDGALLGTSIGSNSGAGRFDTVGGSSFFFYIVRDSGGFDCASGSDSGLYDVGYERALTDTFVGTSFGTSGLSHAGHSSGLHSVRDGSGIDCSPLCISGSSYHRAAGLGTYCGFGSDSVLSVLGLHVELLRP